MEVTERSEKFLWLGNCLALDFVNTQVLHEGPVEDLLQTPGDLLQWFAEAGIIQADSGSPARRLGDQELNVALRGTRDYRKKMRDSLASKGFRRTALQDLITATNQLLAVPTRIERLVATRGGGTKLTSEWEFSCGEDLLRPLAAGTAQMLSSLDVRRIRRCKNPDCILYFYDVSKGNTRAWCSLDICGNKLRMAEFRKRHA